MEIITAKTAGFCFGVEKAVDTAFQAADEYLAQNVPVYTFGQIIHNEAVTKDLSDKGVNIINDVSELKNIPHSAIVIRSHGVERSIYEEIERCGHMIIDATCPFVKHIHDIVNDKSKTGYVVIVGDAGHPEVLGTKGWCNSTPGIVSAAEDIEKLPLYDGEVTIVGQTTFSLQKFEYLVELLKVKYYNTNVCKTICNATEVRQKETMELAQRCDAMIVVGGKNSSNTQKLYDICRQFCENTYYIQEPSDLDNADFGSAVRVGITAGASTPNNIIREVQNHVRGQF